MRKKYKTKFPVARIKKIMQLDEDVGKVAQATPVLISKALELFMQSLIDEACVETRAKNAKRLTVAHLKKTIQDKDQFDFLRDIVANVADPAESSGKGGERRAEKEEGTAAPSPTATTTTGGPSSGRGRSRRGGAAAGGGGGSSGRSRSSRAATAAATATATSNGDVKMEDLDEDEDDEEDDEEEPEEEAVDTTNTFAMMESMAGRTMISGGSIGRKGKSARDEDEDDYDA